MNNEGKIPQHIRNQINSRLDFIYGEKADDAFRKRMFELIESHISGEQAKADRWDEKDILIITYGDSIKNNDEPGLQVLHRFLNKHLKESLSFVHLLPFFPYSSDDGFSVIDYKEVNPDLGDWRNVELLGSDYKLMFDLVINHISRESEWFINYLQGKDPGKDYFIEVRPGTDLSKVVRPRSLPLLTPVNSPDDTRYVWTTFSDDQIDLNFANPWVLYEMIGILLFYMSHGARMIRLDAIAYLWKEPGTSCIHLPETHEIVKLLRDVMELVDPQSILLTETNVPNKENLSYFGNGDEAHMVYQFSLPPLLLHALYSGNASRLTEWAKSISGIPGGCTFFNFTASHDGIGVRPLEGILAEEERDELIEAMKKNGAKISTRRQSDGTDSPYEINITYFDAMKRTIKGEDDLQVKRFIASQTIMMELKGIPAFYIHSLLATENHYEGVKETGRARTINRRKWHEDEIEELLQEETVRSRVMNELKQIIATRREQRAFHPEAHQEALDAGERFFAVRRTSIDGEKTLVCITNVTNKPVVFDQTKVKGPVPDFDLFTKSSPAAATDTFELAPYQTMWLTEGDYFKRDD